MSDEFKFGTWYPIEIAPRNEKMIIIYGVTATGRKVVECYIPGKGAGEIVRSIKFMPLPPPPVTDPA